MQLGTNCIKATVHLVKTTRMSEAAGMRIRLLEYDYFIETTRKFADGIWLLLVVYGCGNQEISGFTELF